MLGATRGRRGGVGAEERPAPGAAAPSSRAAARDSDGRAGGRALTLTKSSMMGSLSSSFSPFSGIDNAMAGSTRLRGHRWGDCFCSGDALVGTRRAFPDSPGVELASASAPQHFFTPRARL